VSMSTYVVGIKPADAKREKMLAAWDACIAAGVPAPDGVHEYFGTDDREELDPAGVKVTIGGGYACAGGVSPYSADMEDGFEVDLRKLDPDIKILRFYNSY
jgi:hypothetical protein